MYDNKVALKKNKKCWYSELNFDEQYFLWSEKGIRYKYNIYKVTYYDAMGLARDLQPNEDAGLVIASQMAKLDPNVVTYEGDALVDEVFPDWTYSHTGILAFLQHHVDCKFIPGGYK